MATSILALLDAMVLTGVDHMENPCRDHGDSARDLFSALLAYASENNISSAALALIDQTPLLRAFLRGASKEEMNAPSWGVGGDPGRARSLVSEGSAFGTPGTPSRSTGRAAASLMR
ncbi:hypothetical protein ACG7TL_008957 [Trametes sanguinea]